MGAGASVPTPIPVRHRRSRQRAASAGWFAELHQRGVLHTPDPMLAAQTFNWLVLSTPLNEAMSRADADTTSDLDRYADEGVRVFLTAHRPS